MGNTRVRVRMLLLSVMFAIGLSGAGVSLGEVPAQARADVPCGPRWQMDTIVNGQGQLENLAPDDHGGVYISELGKAVYYVDANGRVQMVAPPELQATGLQLSGTVLYVLGAGALWHIDTTTGRRTSLVSGLAGPNGLLRLPDGDFLMTRPGLMDQAGPPTGITRFHPATGTVTLWSTAQFTDGIALSEDGRAVYTDNILTGQILRVPLDDPNHWTVVARLPGIAAGPDDLAVTKQGALFVAGHLDGNIYEVQPRTGITCVVASGLGFGWIGPSSVRIGRDGRGWSLLVTDFDGTLRRLRPPPELDIAPA